MVLLQERDQFLADVTAQVPGLRTSGCAHQSAQFDGALRQVCDLQTAHFSIPHTRRLQNAVQFFAYLFYRNRVVRVEKYSSQQIAGLPGPVLKRLLDEVRERQNQAAQV